MGSSFSHCQVTREFAIESIVGRQGRARDAKRRRLETEQTRKTEQFESEEGGEEKERILYGSNPESQLLIWHGFN